MRITRRLRDRRLRRALVVAFVSGASGLVASCSSDRELFTERDVVDASDPADAPDVLDGGGIDVTARPVDPAKSDAAPRPVVCESPPCAAKLVTTLGSVPVGGFCALLDDGTVACWGQNKHGQLGRGPDAGTGDSPTPERVVDLKEIVYLEHTCAIVKEGATWCWGTGPYLRSAAAQTRELVPVKVPIPPATMVSMRATPDLPTLPSVACAVTEGSVLCWGMNRYGQIVAPEIGGVTNSVFSPQPIQLPPGAAITAIAIGNASFVLRADGTAWSWGANPPLGRVSSLVPDPYPRPIALAGVSNLDAVNEAACAVAEGIAYCWGFPFNQITDPPLTRAFPRPIVTPEPVVQISTTSAQANPMVPQRGCACGVSGAVYCWGSNANGQAGDGTTEYAVAPVKVVGLPGPAAEVKTLSRTTCALLTTGKIYCWGDNANGQLGTGQNRTLSLLPQEVRLP